MPAAPNLDPASSRRKRSYAAWGLLPRGLALAVFATAVGAGCVGSVDGPLAETSTPTDPSTPAASPTNPPGGTPPGGTPPSPPGAPADPGRVTMRRLNRAEYNNTVADLLGTATKPADGFPEDGVNHGFDRVADALTISPLLVERYEAAADALVGELFARKADDPTRRRILTCTPSATDAVQATTCATEILTAFARRAWRQPVTRESLAPYLALIDTARKAGATSGDGLALAIKATLLSHRFMFRTELDGQGKGPHPLAPFELASRLSYFLWSSMPDDALLQAAESGTLVNSAGYAAEVDRLMASPRLTALTAEFATQWMGLGKLTTHEVDSKTFPGWTEPLRRSMRAETLRFFDEFLRAPTPAADMLTADFGFADELLGKHYELPTPPAGTAISRVALTGVPRRGLVTQAAILTLTSHPDRTSPTGRGLWVMEHLLCSPPPPPPPGVEGLPAALPMANETLRQRLERHREQPQCRACHAVMDVIGLGLENYDGIGRHRTMDNGARVDGSGDLIGHGKFTGGLELVGLLAKDERVASCLARKLMVFATGRGFEGPDDEASLAAVIAQARAAGGSLRALLTAVANSAPFRMRGAEGVTP